MSRSQARRQCSLRQLIKLINIVGRLDFIFVSNTIWIEQANTYSINNWNPVPAWSKSMAKTKADEYSSPYKVGLIHMVQRLFKAVVQYFRFSNTAYTAGFHRIGFWWLARAVHKRFEQTQHHINQTKANNETWHQVSEMFSFILNLTSIRLFVRLSIRLSIRFIRVQLQKLKRPGIDKVSITSHN